MCNDAITEPAVALRTEDERGLHVRALTAGPTVHIVRAEADLAGIAWVISDEFLEDAGLQLKTKVLRQFILDGNCHAQSEFMRHLSQILTSKSPSIFSVYSQYGADTFRMFASRAACSARLLEPKRLGSVELHWGFGIGRPANKAAFDTLRRGSRR
jgi:hypothetical protein